MKRNNGRKERVNWASYNIYCPVDCINELKKFYLEWKMKNIHRWYQDKLMEGK